VNVLPTPCKDKNDSDRILFNRAKGSEARDGRAPWHHTYMALFDHDGA